MELLLILIYISICYVVFKVFKIPVNQWSLATATLGGIVGIVLLLLRNTGIFNREGGRQISKQIAGTAEFQVISPLRLLRPRLRRRHVG